MLFVVLIAGIDLAVGSQAALSGTFLTMTVLHFGQEPQWFLLGILFGLISGLVIGCIHGFFDAYVGMPSFDVTLATQYAIYGLTQYITDMSYLNVTDTHSIFYSFGNGKLLGVPMPVVWCIVCIAIVAFILNKTPFGRRMYATGGNAKAAELVGINPKFQKMVAYIICSLATALAGMLLVSMNMVSSYKMAQGYEGPVIMALVIGAVNIMGGEGKIGGVAFGAVLVGIINNVLILAGIATDYKDLAQGLVIICAVALNVYTSRKSQGLIDPKRKSIFSRRKAKKVQ
jgi:ribose/xylose/arabinose/galactoside ABC-type transport system permease subunit